MTKAIQKIEVMSKIVAAVLVTTAATVAVMAVGLWMAKNGTSY